MPSVLLDQDNAGMDFSLKSFCQNIYRTSDFLRVKMSQGREERAIPSFPPLLAQSDLLSAPLFPLSTACSDSSLCHGLGHVKKCKDASCHPLKNWELKLEALSKSPKDTSEVL